jgi:hypothetical protein
MSDDLMPLKNEKERESGLDSISDAAMYLLRCFALKYKTPKVEFAAFLSFVERYLEL